MAGLSDRRGQLLLIGGLLLAVAIIALAVVFNSAVVTSTLAGEAEQDVSEQPVRSVQEDVRAQVADLIDRAIEEHPKDRDAQIRYVRSNISAINSHVQRYARGSERIVNVSWNGTTAEEGTFNSTYAKSGSGSIGWYLENDVSNFSSPNSTNPWERNWSVGSNNSVRNFDINVTDINNKNLSLIIRFRGDKGSGPYEVLFNKDTPLAKSPEVRVEGPVGYRGKCEWNLENNGDPYHLHVNFENSTLNGEYCTPIDFFDHIEEPYSIKFENGNVSTGSFSLTTTDGTKRSDDHSTGSYGDNPAKAKWPKDWYRRLYGVLIDIEYYGPQVDYESTIAVAPGEL